MIYGARLFSSTGRMPGSSWLLLIGSATNGPAARESGAKDVQQCELTLKHAL